MEHESFVGSLIFLMFSVRVAVCVKKGLCQTLRIITRRDVSYNKKLNRSYSNRRTLKSPNSGLAAPAKGEGVSKRKEMYIVVRRKLFAQIFLRCTVAIFFVWSIILSNLFSLGQIIVSTTCG